MSTLLVQDADLLVTMEPGREGILGGGLFIRDNVIQQVGTSSELPASADRVLNAQGMIITPGFVNRL